MTELGRLNADGTWQVTGTQPVRLIKIEKQAAANAVESYRRGDRVVVLGTIETETCEDSQGGTHRDRSYVRVAEIAGATTHATLKIRRTTHVVDPR